MTPEELNNVGANMRIPKNKMPKDLTHDATGLVRSGAGGYPLYLLVFNTETKQSEYGFRCQNCSGLAVDGRDRCTDCLKETK